MLNQASQAGRTVAIAGWGAALTVAGLVLAAVAIGYLLDFRGLATRHVKSTFEARRQIRFLVSRPDTPKRLRQSRYAVGGGFLFGALLFLAVGVFEFMRL